MFGKHKPRILAEGIHCRQSGVDRQKADLIGQVVCAKN
jgi:hypothetical protein